ncbi:MAG: cupin domain-containing protein [Hyphomicrobiaceae bacterium]
MPVVRDPMTVTGNRGTAYPPRYAKDLEGRVKRPLTDLLGLTQFGVNVTTLEPGAMSSQRHWHMTEDEFIYVLEGEIALVTDEGEQVLTSGMAAGFPKADGNGHHLINRSSSVATYLEIGTRMPEDDIAYPDVDMVGERRNGSPTRFMDKSRKPYD